MKLKDLFENIVQEDEEGNGDFSLSADKMRSMSPDEFDKATASATKMANPKVRELFKKLEGVMDDRTFKGWTDADVKTFLQRFESWVDVLRHQTAQGATKPPEKSYSGPPTGNFKVGKGQ